MIIVVCNYKNKKLEYQKKSRIHVFVSHFDLNSYVYMIISYDGRCAEMKSLFVFQQENRLGKAVLQNPLLLGQGLEDKLLYRKNKLQPRNPQRIPFMYQKQAKQNYYFFACPEGHREA